MVIEKGMMIPQDPWYRKYYWDARKVAWNCARCSICKWVDSWEIKDARFAKVCPSSLYYLFDSYSSQGRMDASLALLDGVVPYEDPDALEVFYRCNTCGGCDASCKGVQDMEPLRLMLEMRAGLVERGQVHPVHTLYIDHLKKEDNMMLEPKASRGQWAEGLAVKNITEDAAEVVFHAGCRASFDPEMRQTTRDTVQLFSDAGADIGILGKDESCCGGRAYALGYHGEFTKFAESNLELWRNAGVKTVVTGCADGYYAMKRLYPEIGETPEVLHVVQYLERLTAQGKIKYQKPLNLNVTYHDPCHLGRRLSQAPGHYVPGAAIMGLYEEPREIIRGIPGVTLTEMFRIKEYAWCCGAGGGVIEAYPEFNAFTAGERISEAMETDAEAIVTACPWCKRSLTDAARETKQDIRVLDIMELVTAAL